jgi:hypothetical protein
MAVSHAEAGADFVAPSDMMDGRVVRELGCRGFHKVGIMVILPSTLPHLRTFRDAWMLLLTVKIFQRIKDLPNGLCESY